MQLNPGDPRQMTPEMQTIYDVQERYNRQLSEARISRGEPDPTDNMQGSLRATRKPLMVAGGVLLGWILWQFARNLRQAGDKAPRESSSERTYDRTHDRIHEGSDKFSEVG